MSASIHYQPTGNGRRLHEVGSGSDFLDVLQRCFGANSPLVLGPSDIPVLRGMEAASTFNAKGFHELIEVIEQHGEVRLWGEY